MKRIFLILIIFMLSLGIVSAEDLNSTDGIDCYPQNGEAPIMLHENADDNLTDDGEFVDASEAYELLNEFRSEKGAWYWWSDDVTKAYFNTIDTNQLQPIVRNADLEKTAKVRAKEISEYFSHTRPDGTDCFTAFPDSPSARGENIARFYMTCEDVTEAWKETYERFEGQGHRRMMLDTAANCVGIAGYKTPDGAIFWVQDYGVDYNYTISDTEPFIASINLNVPDVVKSFYDSEKKLEITLTDSTVPIANAQIIISLEGVNSTKTTDRNGKAYLDLNQDMGVHKAVVTYGPHAATSKITVIPLNLQVSDVTGVYGDTQLLVNLTNNSLPMSGETIILMIDMYTSLFVPTDSEGIARIDLNDWEVGVYRMEVTYDYQVYEKVKVTIDKIPTSIDSFTLEKLSHNSVRLDASLTPSVSEGKMIFTSNGENYDADIKDSKATLELSDLPAGNYSFSALYPGDEHYEVSYSSENLNFTSEDYKIYLDVENLTKSYGGSEMLNARLSDNDFKMLSNCNVTFNINGKKSTKPTDEKGIASMDINLDAGDYDALVTYQNISATAHITVNQISSKTALSYANTAYDNVTLTAIVEPSAATGDVIFDVNGSNVSSKIADGKAVYELTALEPGFYTVSTFYEGDINHKSSSSNNISFEIKEIKTDVKAPDVTKYYKGPERFVVTVKEDNKPVVGKNVTINLNGKSYNRTTDEKGEASMAVNLNSGVYNVTSEFEGIKVDSTVTVKSTVSGKDVTKIFRNATQYYATFVDTKGNLIKNTDVKFNINGVFYTRTTNGEGVARMNINLPPGTYIITAENPDSTERYTNVIKVLPSIVENHDLTKYYRNESKYTLRIIGDDGNPVGENVTVKLNINGVIYERKTNASGYMSMNINLPPGTYTVTAEYNGLMASNTIKVLSTLETRDLSMKYRDGSKFEAKILDGQGSPYANQTVTFNINGVFYQRTTGDDGIARLSINLMAGEYIITSSFNGLNAANKVTISG